jgi:hypothetical protein
VLRVGMVWSSLAIDRYSPEGYEDHIDNARHDGVPAVHDEHDELDQEDEHGEDGDDDIEVCDTKTSVSFPSSCLPLAIEEE